ncbi:uncharacterized protein FIBRA_08409 [Fibroporia radiculosa]|uniref:Uncharacterized protein n=1 Tax=Fibroporia radiculosa TaxID=599839 RepID=J4GHC1_9APHY|nr:uncharacterized protein FIBRA_08409 [Fibroporia radiculosa]CCM06168.1 predicted protein [Fibroporia radiculosa]
MGCLILILLVASSDFADQTGPSRLERRASAPAKHTVDGRHTYLLFPLRPGTRPDTSHPEPLKFAPSFTEPVGMHIGHTEHYQHNTSEGIAEWAKLIPAGGHVVYIDDDDDGGDGSRPRAYTVTLFHQLKCLDVIRAQYAAPQVPAPPLLRHCMNYLRQSVLCRPNLRIESVKNSVGTAIRSYDAVCRDWTTVYEEAQRNHEQYAARVQSAAGRE